MPTHITVPLPEPLQRQFKALTDENFNLWLFLAQNDLLEEARNFLSLPDSDWIDPDHLPF